jgi:hypothetical protein
MFRSLFSRFGLPPLPAGKRVGRRRSSLLLRQPKIKDLDLPLAPQGLDHKKVRGLDIPTNDALQMCRSQLRRVRP